MSCMDSSTVEVKNSLDHDLNSAQQLVIVHVIVNPGLYIVAFNLAYSGTSRFNIIIVM